MTSSSPPAAPGQGAPLAVRMGCLALFLVALFGGVSPVMWWLLKTGEANNEGDRIMVVNNTPEVVEVLFDDERHSVPARGVWRTEGLWAETHEIVVEGRTVTVETGLDHASHVVMAALTPVAQIDLSGEYRGEVAVVRAAHPAAPSVRIERWWVLGPYEAAPEWVSGAPPHRVVPMSEAELHDPTVVGRAIHGGR